jgi:ubiquitin C-terminal hydrolase
LDLLAEDLYRDKKKPYVETTDAEGKSDKEASKEAWNKHLLRNHSIISDLFHGQYKSTIVCSVCNRVSITFDPFMTLLAPIPGLKQKVEFFYIPYDINTQPEYYNFRGEVYLRDNDNMSHFRQEV